VTDEIALTLPRDRPFHGVAHLVVGGIAARLDVTLEDLEDLQLALDSLLRAHAGQGAVTVRFRIDDDRITTVVGPFEDAGLRSELEQSSARMLSLGRVLDTVADTVDVAPREGGVWVEVTKTVARRVAGGQH
jgi:anti-sigma regulatory factor (Ser/Thr protein kinase)